MICVVSIDCECTWFMVQEIFEFLLEFSTFNVYALTCVTVSDYLGTIHQLYFYMILYVSSRARLKY